MKNKRVIISVISFLLIIDLIAAVYLTSFHLNVFNEKFYSKEFKKYNIYGEFPNNDIDKVNSGLLLYLRGEGEDYNKELFDENEIRHLEDVKIVFQKGYTLYYSVLITAILLFFILFLLSRKHFLKDLSFVLFFTGVFTLFFTVVLLILVWLNFDGLFTMFHHIFFPQGGWLFNASDNIIKLYPSGLFYDIAKRIFTSIILYGNILIGAGVLLFYTRK